MQEGDKMEDVKLTWSKNIAVHPNLINYNNNWTVSDWTKEAQTEAVRFWQQSLLLGNSLNPKQITDLVTGKYEVIIDEEGEHYKVTLKWIGEEE